jgi:hypothetical protein
MPLHPPTSTSPITSIFAVAGMAWEYRQFPEAPQALSGTSP